MGQRRMGVGRTNGGDQHPRVPEGAWSGVSDVVCASNSRRTECLRIPTDERVTVSSIVGLYNVTFSHDVWSLCKTLHSRPAEPFIHLVFEMWQSTRVARQLDARSGDRLLQPVPEVRQARRSADQGTAHRR